MKSLRVAVAAGRVGDHEVYNLVNGARNATSMHDLAPHHQIGIKIDGARRAIEMYFGGWRVVLRRNGVGDVLFKLRGTTALVLASF
jgi:hypothetical protein